VSPELLFWSGFGLKMVMTATAVVIASLAVERSGPFIGGLIGALPAAAAPAYVILALDHPPDFIAASAVGSVAINCAVTIFATIYVLLAQRHGLLVSLGGAGIGWLAVAAALRLVAWTPLSAIALNVVVYAVTIPLSRRFRGSTGPVSFVRTRLDIPLRALTVALVVSVVTGASSRIGSFASGMFALFPIILGSSIVIMHPRIGGKATASMLANVPVPLIGMALGFVAVHYLVAPIGVWPALAGGLLVSLAWSGLLLAVRLQQQKRRHAISSSATAP
jgi:uncharacterized membrane protein (GlpM family)